MNPRLLACFLLVFSTGLTTPNQAQRNKPDPPVKASVCQLKSDPAAYEHKLVEVTGFAAQRGRESFDVCDPGCPEWPDIKLKYGGERIEEITTRFVDDARSKQFENSLYTRHG